MTPNDTGGAAASPELPGTGPWRLLILDRDPADPKWMIASVALAPDGVMAARLDAASRYLDWEEVTGWVWSQIGPAALVPLHDPAVWRVDRGGSLR